MRLQDITLDDLALFETVYSDPRMLTHLGDPMPKEQVPQKLRSVVDEIAGGKLWYFKIVLDEQAGQAAGSVCVWESEWQGQPVSEIGWAISPEFQGQGLGSRAVAAVLDKARAEKRWGVIHAFPSVDNGPSNGIARKLGFTLVGEGDMDYRGHALHVNHWQIDVHNH